MIAAGESPRRPECALNATGRRYGSTAAPGRLGGGRSSHPSARARFTDDAHRPCSRCGVGRSRISLRGIPVHLPPGPAAEPSSGRLVAAPNPFVHGRRCPSAGRRRPRGACESSMRKGASFRRSISIAGRRRVLLERVGCSRTEGRARSVLRVARESGQRHAGRPV